ncbi:MAG: hypothetical protein JF606_09395 [Burkholderiales bacterium]|nr:hypothetical protein [Burkholderiales bacterium]
MNQCSCARVALAATLAIAGFATPAVQAARLTFEELPHADELTGVGPIVQSKGFILTYNPAPGEAYPVGFMSVGPSWRFNGRSTALLSNSCTSIVTLRADTNVPITLHSIDLAPNNGDEGAAVTFLGLKTDNTYVRTTIVLSPKAVWKTYRLPDTFSNLQEARWVQGDCFINPPHMFDNVRVHPTTQPPADE